MHRCRSIVIGLALGAALTLATRTAASVSFATTIEEGFQRSAIVCVADAIEFVPAPEPTEAMPMTIDSYRVRVSHVWKGDPPDTLTLFGDGGRMANSRTWSSGGTPHLTPGVRYVIFANVQPGDRLRAEQHSGDLATHAAELLWLARNLPAPRPGAPNSDDLPDVSFHRLAFELETGDSLASTLAALALRQLADSSGALVPRVARVLWSDGARWRREGANIVLGTWSAGDRAARVAILRTLDRGDAETKLVVLSPRAYPYRVDEELQRRIFEHRENPSAEVRAAVLQRSEGLVSSAYPPIRGFTAALRDPSPRVRLAAIHALRETPLEHCWTVIRALEPLIDGPDPELARAARSAQGRLVDRLL